MRIGTRSLVLEDELGRVPLPTSSPSAATRKAMQGNRSRDTRPEVAIRSAVHRRGMRYRVASRPLPGLRRTADLVFSSERVAVFVDGCFWHGCALHCRLPKSNAEYWTAKVARNLTRDRETDQTLRRAGWIVIRVWEHDRVDRVTRKIEETVTRRRALNKRELATKQERTHGTASMYSRNGCRCQLCRAAKVEYQRQLRARYKAEGGRGRHGTSFRYETGCRCGECRQAHNVYQKQLLTRYRQEGGHGTHGTHFRYDTGCRCDDCREVHNAKSRMQKRRARELRRGQ